MTETQLKPAGAGVKAPGGLYARWIKRALDFVLSLCAILVLSPLLLLLTVIGAIAMKGNPFFVQPRPGKKKGEWRGENLQADQVPHNEQCQG